MKKLLFVDDDRDFLQANKIYFSRKGYEVLCSDTPREALKILSFAAIDCIILDIDMPDMDGFEFCERLREISGVPIIFLSGMTEAKNRVKSFKVGGDDFLAKPCDILELELRIQARMNTSNTLAAEVLTFEELVIDIGRRIVSYRGKEGDFSALQFDILCLLARNPGKVFSYEQIYDRIWKTPIVGSKHNLQVAVATVRQKLAALCPEKNYIQTAPRKGYYFSLQ